MNYDTYMNHDEEYPQEYLANILNSVKTIAMIGASPDPTKFSYGVLRVLNETGYEMLPVNPKEAGKKIRGLKVYESISKIDKKIDMVQVFRDSKFLVDIAKEAIKINAKVLWGQIGVKNFMAKELQAMEVIKNYMKKNLFLVNWLKD